MTMFLRSITGQKERFVHALFCFQGFKPCIVSEKCSVGGFFLWRRKAPEVALCTTRPRLWVKNHLLCYFVRPECSVLKEPLCPSQKNSSEARWQHKGQHLAGSPTPPEQPQGCSTAAIERFLDASCFAKHLEPMSRAALAECHSVFFKRTVERVLMPTPTATEEEKNTLAPEKRTCWLMNSKGDRNCC